MTRNFIADEIRKNMLILSGVLAAMEWYLLYFGQ
jgi:hypothetical protein